MDAGIFINLARDISGRHGVSIEDGIAGATKIMRAAEAHLETVMKLVRDDQAAWAALVQVARSKNLESPASIEALKTLREFVDERE